MSPQHRQLSIEVATDLATTGPGRTRTWPTSQIRQGFLS